jgi:hypothetical protein
MGIMYHLSTTPLNKLGILIVSDRSRNPYNVTHRLHEINYYKAVIVFNPDLLWQQYLLSALQSL